MSDLDLAALRTGLDTPEGHARQQAIGSLMTVCMLAGAPIDTLRKLVKIVAADASATVTAHWQNGVEDMVVDAATQAGVKLLEAERAVTGPRIAELEAEVERLRALLAQEETAHGRTIDERDQNEAWADKLAEAIAPLKVIGEHSSGNNPWANAYEIAETSRGEVERLRAEIDQIAAMHCVRGPRRDSDDDETPEQGSEEGQ